MERYSVAIIGGGIAGAASAFFLAGRGARNVVILEKERTPGAHSTGRNAAILRTVISDPVIRSLAFRAAAFYRRPPEGFASHPLVNAVGIYLAAREEYRAELLTCLAGDWAERAPRQVEPSHLYQRIPFLAPGLEAVLYHAEDGVFDVDAILQAFLRGACSKGAELRTSCEAGGICIRGGRIEGLETSDGFLPAARLLIAGGGWAAALAEHAGYPLPMVPHRRHLLVTEPLPQVDPRWPVVWMLGEEYYFRPESGGLLMSGCDTVAVPPDLGEVADPAEVERIAAKAARWLPSFSEARVARSWAGMRTSPVDQRFVIGADPRLEGLYWAAGLGGHGITCAPAVGELAAEWVVDGASRDPLAPVLAPDRLIQQ